MTQLEAFAKALNAVYDAMAAPPKKLCDACLKMFEEQEGRSVMTDFGREWWCEGCIEVVEKNSEPVERTEE